MRFLKAVAILFPLLGCESPSQEPASHGTPETPPKDGAPASIVMEMPTTRSTVPPNSERVSLGDEPFGFQRGMSIDALRATAHDLKKISNTPETFLTHSPPKPNPHFNGYLLVLDPRLGLCMVQASSPVLPQYESQNLFVALRGSLDSKFNGSSKPPVFPSASSSITWNRATSPHFPQNVESVKLTLSSNQVSLAYDYCMEEVVRNRR